MIAKNDKEFQMIVIWRDLACVYCQRIDETLVGHHIARKRTERLRLDTKGGVCLCGSNGCHGKADRHEISESWLAWERPGAQFQSEDEYLKFKNLESWQEVYQHDTDSKKV